MHAGQLVLQLRAVRDGVDPLQHVGDRLDPGALGRRRVHAGRVEGAELPRDGIGRRRRLRGGTIEDSLEHQRVPLGELVERAPARERGRDRVPLDPPVVGEHEEVLAGAELPVDARRIERRHRDGGLRTERCGEQQGEERNEYAANRHRQQGKGYDLNLVLRTGVRRCARGNAVCAVRNARRPRAVDVSRGRSPPTGPPDLRTSLPDRRPVLRRPHHRIALPCTRTPARTPACSTAAR